MTVTLSARPSSIILVIKFISVTTTIMVSYNSVIITSFTIIYTTPDHNGEQFPLQNNIGDYMCLITTELFAITNVVVMFLFSITNITSITNVKKVTAGPSSRAV